jgi:hypothetical protein
MFWFGWAVSHMRGEALGSGGPRGKNPKSVFFVLDDKEEARD